MLYSLNLGLPRGYFNLGNQLFVIASLLGMARRYGTHLLLQQEWEYRYAFNLTDVEISPCKANVFLREPAFTCCLPFFDKFAEISREDIVGIDGYLQSELYWKDYVGEIRRNLSFKEEIRTAMLGFLDSCGFEINHFVAISVRRGDFATDPNHYLLPREYYANAYKKHFDGCGVFIFSDDILWCRQNLSGISDKMFFADGLSAIRQLCLMSMFEKFVIANSTFSWWGAYLSSAKEKRVVRPLHHFDGELKTASILDHYPKDWIVFDHE